MPLIAVTRDAVSSPSKGGEQTSLHGDQGSGIQTCAARNSGPADFCRRANHLDVRHFMATRLTRKRRGLHDRFA